MGMQAALASFGGDLWRSWKAFAFWPYPAVVVGRHRPKVTADDYRCFTRLLQPGDFLLTRSEPYFISNYFIGRNGTAFSHLAIYTGAVTGYRDQETGCIMKPQAITRDNGWESSPGVFKRTVTHAISEGVVCQDLLEVMLHSDWVVAIRPWANQGEGYILQRIALSQVGLEYNFDFKPEGPPALYCTELGVFCLEKAGIQIPAKDLAVTSLLGVVVPVKKFKSFVTLADAFLQFKMVCCSVSCNEPAFARKSRFVKTREVLLKAPDASVWTGCNTQKKEPIDGQSE